MELKRLLAIKKQGLFTVSLAALPVGPHFRSITLSEAPMLKDLTSHRFISALILSLSLTLPASTQASGAPWLGVAVDALSFDELKQLNLDYGLRVEAIRPDSPAAEAGLKQGDLLLELDGHILYSVGRLQWLIRRHQPGDKLTLLYRRNNQNLQAEVTLGAWQERYHPFPTHPYSTASYLGLRLQTLSDALRRYFGAPTDAGMLISEVVENSPAAEGGLKVGDVIIRMDRKMIHDMADIRRVLNFFEPGDTIEMKVIRDHAPQTLKVTLGRTPYQRDFPPPNFMHRQGDRFGPHAMPPYPPPIAPFGAIPNEA